MWYQSANCLGALGSPLTRWFLSFAGHIVRTGKKNYALAALLWRSDILTQKFLVWWQFISFLKLNCRPRILNFAKSSMNIRELHWMKIRIIDKDFYKCNKRTFCNILLGSAAFSASIIAIPLTCTWCSLQCSLFFINTSVLGWSEQNRNF